MDHYHEKPIKISKHTPLAMVEYHDLFGVLKQSMCGEEKSLSAKIMKYFEKHFSVTIEKVDYIKQRNCGEKPAATDSTCEPDNTIKENSKLFDSSLSVFEDSLRPQKESSTEEIVKSTFLVTLFSCLVCFDILSDPITLQCRHSYCKKCAQDVLQDRPCLFCGRLLSSVEISECKTNLNLSDIIQKLFPGRKNTKRMETVNEDKFNESQMIGDPAEWFMIRWYFLLTNPAKHDNPEEPSIEDLQCPLCYQLFYLPVTTQCGHTFCRSCLLRCLDHNRFCPLCKICTLREPKVTAVLYYYIKTIFPREYAQRRQQYLKELHSKQDFDKNTIGEIPIFVCTTAFPFVSCRLHVFEPRYKLMLRRCLETGNNQFGMCPGLEQVDGECNEIGTLLDNRNITYLPDGRSILDTVGVRRFIILEKRNVDGYQVAKIKLLFDETLLSEENIADLQQLHTKALHQANDWIEGLSPSRQDSITKYYGSRPDLEINWIKLPDGPAWIWWILAILPLEQKAQCHFLSIRNLDQRIKCIMAVVKLLKGNKDFQ